MTNPSANVIKMNPPDLKSRLLEQLATAIILCEQNGNIIQANAAAESLLSVSLHTGDSLFERLPQDGILAKIFERAKTEKQSFLIRELELPPLPGSSPRKSIVFDCTVSPDTFSDSIILELHDRQRLKNIREENDLWEQQSITKKITRQLAHEIKNPLAGIRGAAQLLEKQLDEGQQRFTQLVISEVDRLALLADNLLGPVKPLNKKLQNIHSVLQHVVQLVDSDSSHKAGIIRDYDPSLPDIKVDRNHLIQVFLNLSRNAIQAMQESKTRSPNLRLQTRALNHYTIGKKHYPLVLCVRFIDNGPGVPEDIEEHLFYPLVSSRASGTGIGLAISQLLVQRHDGLIEYRRNPKTDHTEFTVLLPYT
ncbi:MAG: PAS domain-containing sensor histidine kinase [Gammaproteobacteria bacterium]|nr:PAS domain-containing sensor histidine kinase [Gammaproteobacteria bacterium]